MNNKRESFQIVKASNHYVNEVKPFAQGIMAAMNMDK